MLVRISLVITLSTFLPRSPVAPTLALRYKAHEIAGLNKCEFKKAVGRLLSQFEGKSQVPSEDEVEGSRSLQAGAGRKPPKEKDLLKAFDLADADRSGVVDFGEFVRLYAMVKSGRVDGIGGSFRLFGVSF